MRRWSSGHPSELGGLIRMVLPRQAEEKLALPNVREAWGDVVGRALATRTCVEDLEEGVLFVRAESSAAAKRVSMGAASYAEALSKKTGFPVQSVKVATGRATPRTPSVPPKPPSPLPPPPVEEVERRFEEVKEMFSQEAEPTARSLASLMVVYKKRFPR